MLFAAAALFSLQFLFNKKFEEENGSSLSSSMLFSFLSSLAGLVILFVINGFRVSFSPFSLLWAAAYAVDGILFTVASVKAFSTVNLSAYSIFSMLGGMLLPSVYGIIFCNEQLTLFKALCFVLIAVSVAFTVDFKSRGKGLFYYIAVFVLNGLVGIISVIHQADTLRAVDSFSFLFLARAVSAAISAGFVIKGTKTTKKSVIYSGGFAAFSTIGNLLILLSLKHLPASVQYPVITGGTVVISLFVSILRREKAGIRNIIATAVAFAATVMLMHK